MQFIGVSPSGKALAFGASILGSNPSTPSIVRGIEQFGSSTGS